MATFKYLSNVFNETEDDKNKKPSQIAAQENKQLFKHLNNVFGEPGVTQELGVVRTREAEEKRLAEEKANLPIAEEKKNIFQKGIDAVKNFLKKENVPQGLSDELNQKLSEIEAKPDYQGFPTIGEEIAAKSGSISEQGLIANSKIDSLFNRAIGDTNTILDRSEDDLVARIAEAEAKGQDTRLMRQNFELIKQAKDPQASFVKKHAIASLLRVQRAGAEIQAGLAGVGANMFDFFTEAAEREVFSQPQFLRSDRLDQMIREEKGFNADPNDLVTRKASQALKKWSEETAVDNPTWADKVAQGSGSMIGFTLLNYVSGGNATIPAIAESVLEGASVYEENRQQGKSIEEAALLADQDLVANLIINKFLNIFELSNEQMSAIKKSLSGTTTEGLQEGLQQIASNVTTGRPWDEGLIESMAVGGVLGGVTTFVLPNGETVEIDVNQAITEQQQEAPTPEVGQLTEVPLADIVTNLEPVVEERANTQTPKIKELEAAITRGDELPPIPVFERDGQYVTNKDGFNRLSAYRNLEVENVPVRIEEETTLTGTQKQQLERTKAEEQRLKKVSKQEILDRFKNEGDFVSAIVGGELSVKEMRLLGLNVIPETKSQPGSVTEPEGFNSLEDFFNRNKKVTQPQKIKEEIKNTTFERNLDQKDFDENIKPKVEALPALQEGQTIVIQSGSSPYVDTDIKAAVNRGVNRETKVAIVEENQLQLPEDQGRADRGERILPNNLRDVTDIAINKDVLETQKKDIAKLKVEEEKQITAKEVVIPETQQQQTRPVDSQGKLKKSKSFTRVQDRLEEEYRGDAFYNQISLADNTARSIDFVKNYPERALRIAKGLEDAPEGFATNIGISLAMAEKAREDGDYKLYADLEKSLSLRGTRGGQEIVSFKGRFNDHSPHTFIKRVLKARLEATNKAKFTFKKLQKVTEAIDTQAKNVRKFINKETLTKIESAQSIIDALTC